MKPYIDRGQVKIIGVTTEEEYQEYIKSENAFNRRFKNISDAIKRSEFLYKAVRNSLANDLIYDYKTMNSIKNKDKVNVVQF